MTGRTLAGAAAAAVVAGVVVAGLILAGPPSAARAERLDAERVEDLERLARQVDVYWSRHKELPASLEALAGEPGLDPPVDPGTAAPYDYRPVGATRFELCADFETESAARDRPAPRQVFWAHGVGRQCFAVEVVQELRTPRSPDGTGSTAYPPPPGPPRPVVALQRGFTTLL